MPNFFVKITSSWTVKNAIHKYMASVIGQLENQLVEDRSTAIDFVNQHLTMANRRNPRCKAEVLNSRISYNGQNWLLTTSSFEITIYPVAGTFIPAAHNTDLPARFVSPQGPDVTLDLFS